MKSLARIGLGLALAITLTAPAGLASTAALATENVPELAEQVEVDPAQAPDVTESGMVESTNAENAPAPDPEPAVESESEPTPAPEPALEPAPQAQFIAPPEEAEPAAIDEDETAENDETAAPVESDEAASTPRAESQPRLPEVSSGSAQLLPPNTARYVTFRVLDHTGAPAQRTVVNIPGAGERVVDSQGEATYLSLPYGDHTFAVSPSLNSRPDLQSYTGNVTVAQEQHLFTVTLLQKPGVSAIGFQGLITDAQTGDPLLNGFIWVEPVDESADRFTASTNTDGTYWISGLENKPYKVIFESYGYESVNRIVVPSSSYPTHEVALSPSRYYARGLITDPDGYPVRGARVELIDPVTGTLANGNPSSSSSGYYTASFEVSVGSPAPGMYLMRVVPPVGTDLAPTYYPGVYDKAQAVPADFSGLAPRVDLTLLGTQLLAQDDSYTTQPWDGNGTTLDITDHARGLLANDDGYKSIRVSGIQGVVNANSPSVTRSTDHGGEVEVFTDGTFSYAPPANFAGVDTFTYMLRDEGPIAVSTATVRITVGDADDEDDEEPVVLRNDDYTTPFETLLDRTGECETIGVGANDDGDIKDFVLVDNAAHGSLDFDDKGCFTYLPDAGFSGSDAFTYTVTAGPNSDPSGLTATVTIDVGDEGAPVANDDEYRVKSNVSFIMPAASEGILANDTGLSTLSVYAVLGEPVIPNFSTFTTEGNRLLMSADGTFTFIPEDGFTGTDAVTYTVIDEDGRISEPATVRFIVSSDDGGAAGSGSSDGTLATTGSSATPLGWALGIAALLVTAGALWMSRMRRRLGSSQGQA